MKIAKVLTLGLLGGLLYAFISFYLITPYLRNNLPAVGFFGLQGVLFSLFYICLDSLSKKRMLKDKESNRLGFNIIIGAISGLISGSFNIIITYYSAVITFSGTVTNELKKSIISELVHYSFGCIVIGSIIGIVVAYVTNQGRTLGRKCGTSIKL